MVSAHLAYGATTVIYPTGINPTDVQNVQAAVNQGGSILLKAVNQAGQAQSFNFGTWADTGSIPANASVTLTANVSISGEQIGGNRTTISGGVVPFYEYGTAVKASISSLKFLNPQGAAISIWRSLGITISNNEVANIQPYMDNGGTQNLGFFIGGLNGSVSGPVVISGNYIHGIDAQYEFGMELDSVGTAMTITGNTVQVGYNSDSSAGQQESEGIAIVYCPGTANVSGNNVSVGTGVCYNGIVVRGPATGTVNIIGNQVIVGNNPSCFAGIGIVGSTGTANILGNVIDTQSPMADGILLEGNSNAGPVTGATIALNGIDIDSSYFGAIGLVGAVSKCSVSLNLIAGNSAYALSASSDGNPSDICSSNSFLTNLLFGFSATDATIFLDTNTANNVVKSPYVSVINNGTGNSIAQ